MKNNQIDPNSLFGRVMLVFFWGGLAAIIVIYLDRIFNFQKIDALLLAVIINMFLVWLKNFVFGVFNKG